MKTINNITNISKKSQFIIKRPVPGGHPLYHNFTALFSR